MSVFNDFDENGKLVERRKEILNQNNFQRYLTEYGIERTSGYKDALEDMLDLFGPELWTNYNRLDPNLINHSTLRRNITKLADAFCEQQSLLRYANKKIKKQSANKPSL